MEIQTFYPQHPLLQQYIAYYYFLKTDSPDFNAIYYSYPNTLQTLNIHKKADCTLEPRSIWVNECKEDSCLTIVQGKFDSPLLVRLSGRLDKITIAFKPFGLSQFVRQSLGRISPDHSQVFAEWDKDKSYSDFLTSFYAIEGRMERIGLLEVFLLGQCQPLRENQLLSNVLAQLTDFDHEQSIPDIAKNVGLGEKTLNRIFQRYIGINPVSFKKIARFRHSLNNQRFQERFASLTEIGYESNFYDQSYFIRMYKKITSESPSSFFKSIDRLADDQVVFKFLNEIEAGADRKVQF